MLQFARGKRSNVVVAGHMRPMATQDGAGERGGLTECDRLEAGAFEAEGKPADAAEQVKDKHKLDLGKNA